MSHPVGGALAGSTAIPEALSLDEYGTYIGGTWREGRGEPLRVDSPSTGQALMSLTCSSVSDADEAVQAAHNAQPGWSRLSIPERGRRLLMFADALDAHAEELAVLLALEVGKPIAQGRGELEFASGTLRYQAGWAYRLLGEIVPSDRAGESIHLLRVPVGVVIAICAWNFPMAMFCRKVAPALLAGNAVVLKASELTPLSAVALTHLAEQASIPPGVLNLVTGGRDIGRALVEHPGADMVTMTGSISSGKAVMAQAAPHLAKVSLELGGKAPAIVWSDADLDVTVPAIVTARHTNSGQVCTSAERVYVHEEVIDQFLNRYTAAVRQLRVGNPFDRVDMGPLASRAQKEKVESAVAEALQGGAEEVARGEIDSGVTAGGFWTSPTVILDPPPACRLMRDEVFGPVTPVVPVSTTAEFLYAANDSDYGLSGYVFSNDYAFITEVIKELQCGEIYINRTLGEAIQGHHSGHKQSGVGGEDGLHGLLRYTQIRTVYHNAAARSDSL